MKLRKFTEGGIERFADYLAELRQNPTAAPPLELLVNGATSQEIANIDVVPQVFGNRLEAGVCLQKMLEHADVLNPERDKGLWAWLSLFHFDSVCPPDRQGWRKPGATARHIPDTANFQRYYRHLLAGPWRIVRTFRDAPESALAVLCQALDKPGDIVEQLASRQELVTNRALIAAATYLYVDPVTKLAKSGSGGKSRGAPRRLADICNQLDVTWDLYFLEDAELLDKLPKEFDRFRAPR